MGLCLGSVDCTTNKGTEAASNCLVLFLDWKMSFVHTIFVEYSWTSHFRMSPFVSVIKMGEFTLFPLLSWASFSVEHYNIASSGNLLGDA